MHANRRNPSSVSMLACRATAISDGDRARLVGIEPLKELPVHKSLLSPGMRQKMCSALSDSLV